MSKRDRIDLLYDCIRRRNLKDFYPYATSVFYDEDKPERECIFIKGTADGEPRAKVLAVAHTDYVSGKDLIPVMTLDRKKIQAIQLDDRLGCWVVLHVLKDYFPKDMPYDILLTDFEEKHDSTADLFTSPDHQYNWIFQFDRKGLDVVMYNYGTDELKALIKSYGFECDQRGTFTDICELGRLGCAAFNFGVAYYNQHTKDCYADLDELAGQIKRFIKFYREQYNNFLAGKDQSVKKKSGTIETTMCTMIDTELFDENLYNIEKSSILDISDSDIDLLLAGDAAARARYWNAKDSTERAAIVDEVYRSLKS